MPTLIHHGDRIARAGRLRLGATATLFSPDRTRIFLTQRNDNFLWCLPGGGMDPGETIVETVVREMREETGLVVRVLRLIGFYSNPDYLVEYADGNRVQIVAANFEAEIISGDPANSDEVAAYGFFTANEAAALDVMEHHRIRIADAFGESSLWPHIR